MARPRTEINWIDFDKLCAIQCTEKEIADFCGCCVDTLSKRCKERWAAEYQEEEEKEGGFQELYDKKRGAGKISIRRAQYRKGVENNDTAMLIWLGKQYLGQEDKSKQDHTGGLNLKIEYINGTNNTDNKSE